MPYTDEDDADLKRIASGKSGMFSKEYSRQFKSGKKSSEPKSAPSVAPRPVEDPSVTEEMSGRKGADAGEIGKKWDDTFSA